MSVLRSKAHDVLSPKLSHQNREDKACRNYKLVTQPHKFSYFFHNMYDIRRFWRNRVSWSQNQKSARCSTHNIFVLIIIFYFILHGKYENVHTYLLLNLEYWLKKLLFANGTSFHIMIKRNYGSKEKNIQLGETVCSVSKLDTQNCD
jgi:hypothetical protein